MFEVVFWQPPPPGCDTPISAGITVTAPVEIGHPSGKRHIPTYHPQTEVTRSLCEIASKQLQISIKCQPRQSTKMSMLFPRQIQYPPRHELAAETYTSAEYQVLAPVRLRFRQTRPKPSRRTNRGKTQQRRPHQKEPRGRNESSTRRSDQVSDESIERISGSALRRRKTTVQN